MIFRKFFNKRLNLKNRESLQSLVGIGDIMFYEVDRNNNKLIINTLKKLFEIVEQLFLVKKIDPEKFFNLVLSQEYLSLEKRNPEEAKFNFSFSSENYTVGFTSVVDQILRVYQRAVQVDNLEVARFSIYNLNKILHFLSGEDETDSFVKQMLRKSCHITLQAINTNDIQLFNHTISWYREIIFNYDDKFKVKYLNDFDNCFLSSVRLLISENKFHLFKDLVANIVDGLYPNIGSGEIWEYAHLLLEDNYELYSEVDSKHDLQNQIKILSDSIKSINSTAKLDSWLIQFEILKVVIEKALSTSKINAAKELESKINKSVRNQFKLNNLRNLFIYIGAFCIFHNRVKFIRFLWNYKQPPDSDSIWIGNDVLPENLDELMSIYFDLSEDLISFEGHSGGSKYIRKYFLLLLCRLLPDAINIFQGSPSTINFYQLPDMDIHDLKNLTYRLVELAESASELKNDEQLLLKLGFERGEKIIDEKLLTFIAYLQSEAEIQISAKRRDLPVSQNKINEFKDKFIAEFYRLATLRAIITKYFRAYSDSIDVPVADNVPSLGINRLEDKALFFESWYIDYGNWQRSFAQSMASGENKAIFESISNRCIKVSANNINQLFEKVKVSSETVIITSEINVWKFFENNSEFKASWRNDVERIDLQGFKGLYCHNEFSIPVFAINNINYNKAFLLLDKNKLGVLKQLSPLSVSDTDNFKKDIFYMNINLLVMCKDILEKIIDEQPEWLRKGGNEESQNLLIREKIVIQIFEKFEFTPSSDFWGYKWESIHE